MYKTLISLVFASALLATPTPGHSQGAKPGDPEVIAATKAQTETKSAKRQPTAAQIAARERQTKCAAEWKQAKTDGKIEKGMKWPQYWSACNKRLKAAAM